jgi:hypothetical protein
VPATPHRDAPGALREDEEITLGANPGAPSGAGGLRFDGSVFQFRDAAGTFDPRSAGSGISAGTHLVLDQLVHDVAETSYEEVTRSGGQVTSDIVWTDNTKITKVRETLITRSGGQVDTVVMKQYDAGGALVQTLTGTITRSGGQVESIAWVLS